MIRTMLLDDEYWICKLMENLVDWEKYGFTLVAQAYDGVSGYEQILSLRPDVVFTDIRMSGMTGIEIIEKCRTSAPETRFVIISGYSDFEYAKTAIKNGVLGYLLKPVDPTELQDILVQIRSSISQDMDKAAKEQRLQEELAEKKHKYAQQYFGNLLSRSGGPETLLTLEQVNAECNTAFRDGDGYQMFLFAIDSQGGKGKLYPMELEKLVVQCQREAAGACTELVTSIQNNCVYCLANFTPARRFDVSQAFRSVFFSAKLSLSEVLKCSLTLCVGRAFNRFDAFPQLLYSVQEAYYARIQLGLDRVIEADALRYEAPAEGELFPREEREAVDSVLYRKTEAPARQIADSLLDKYRDPAASPMALVRLCEKIAQYVGSVTGDALWSHSEGSSREETMAALQAYYQLDQFGDFLETLLTNAEAVLNSDRKDQTAVNVMKAYLDEHFTESVTLEELSRLVFLNSKYVSDLFRKETDVTVTDYITAKRLELAKQRLLSTDDRLSDIAALTGYNDVKYFIRVFKRQVGVSPMQFRRLYQ